MPAGQSRRDVCQSRPARTIISRACSGCATTRIGSTARDSMSLPRDRVTAGTSYSYERYNALSRSRQANPGVQFTDPSQELGDGRDRPGAFADPHAPISPASPEKIDLDFSYDFSRARARYEYITGPVADRTLPEEVDRAHHAADADGAAADAERAAAGTADATYALTSRLSVGLSYWYERYRVEDFTLDADANPDLARGQALLMGYLYRPYTANTVWGRLIYAW